MIFLKKLDIFNGVGYNICDDVIAHLVSVPLLSFKMAA